MLKHKLFKQDAWSLPDLSKKEDLPLEVNCNQSDEPECSYTHDRGIVINNIMTTPLAKRKKIASAESANKNHCELLPDPETSKPSTSKDGNYEKKSESHVSCFYENESENFYNKYFPTNYKLPYSYKEDEMILKFVLKEQNIFRTSSLSLWKYLEAKMVKPKRTYQSLKNRFMRNIKPHLFTSFQHLIDSKETVEKILNKFPELRMEHKNQKFLSNFGVFKVEKKPIEEAPILNSNLNNCEVEITKKTEVPLIAFSESELENFIQSGFDSSKTPESERIVKLHKNVIQVSIYYSKPEVAFPTVLRLSERFEKLKKNKLLPCPTCGRSFSSVSNASSDSEWSEENEIPNSVPTRTDQSNGSTSSRHFSRKLSSRSWTSRKDSDCQNLLRSLEKSDKLDGNSEEPNSLSEEATEKDEIEDIVEVVETPIMEIKTEKDETMENDGDIDLIYENTVERFQKLIDAEEEKTSQEKCLNKDSDSIGFDDNPEKNLDSFFLGTPLELEMPTGTPQVEVSSTGTPQVEDNSTRTQSQRVTRSSALASNMIKMMTDKRRSKRKCQK